jgi:hypothetical protein
MRSLMCALGLLVLVPLTAAAQEPAPAAAPASPADAAAPTPAQATAPTTEPEAEPEEKPEPTEPYLSLSAQLGAGYISGGGGGGGRAPLALDVQVLTVREPRFLIGGALRIELEGANAVAGIFRFQLRHPFGPIELRPGIGVPFYIAPRTMLGPEAGICGRMTFSPDLALLAAFTASALVMGDDIPKGTTVIMLQVFVGAELFI